VRSEILIGITGEIQMDFRADRISDFMVYRLSDRATKYEKYMHIPLTAAASNITDCMAWMVGSAAFPCFCQYFITAAEATEGGYRLRNFVEKFGTS